jgi:hypothetical protein
VPPEARQNGSVKAQVKNTGLTDLEFEGEDGLKGVMKVVLDDDKTPITRHCDTFDTLDETDKDSRVPTRRESNSSSSQSLAIRSLSLEDGDLRGAVCQPLSPIVSVAASPICKSRLPPRSPARLACRSHSPSRARNVFDGFHSPNRLDRIYLGEETCTSFEAISLDPIPNTGTVVAEPIIDTPVMLPPPAVLALTNAARNDVFMRTNMSNILREA